MPMNADIAQLYTKLHTNRRVTVRCVDFATFTALLTALRKKHWAINGLIGRTSTLKSKNHSAEQLAKFWLEEYDPPTFEILEELTDESNVCSIVGEDIQTGSSGGDLPPIPRDYSPTGTLQREVQEQDNPDCHG